MTSDGRDPDTDGKQSQVQTLARLFAAVSQAMNSVGTLWVFALMLLICADITARNLFASPIRGVPEIVGYSIVGTIYLQLANTLHAGRFTRAELVIEWLESRKPLAGFSLNALFNLIGAVIFLLITVGVWPKLVDAWNENEVAGVPGDFTFAVWPFKLLIVCGALATAIEFVFRFCDNVTQTARTWRKDATMHAPLAWLVAAAALVVCGYLISLSSPSNVQVGAISILCMLLLIYAGMPIGLALILLGFAGIWVMKGNTLIAERALALAASEYLRNYFFGVVPLFVLMGLLVSASDVGRETFHVARWALRRLKGGLGIATVAANAIFAAITGSSIASAAVFTRVAAPEMITHGYTPRFAVGVVAGSSVLGMLIPPSLLLIVYGFLAEQSVGVLFVAAIVPGLILAAAFALLILGLATWKPEWIGGFDSASGEDPAEETILSAAWETLPDHPAHRTGDRRHLWRRADADRGRSRRGRRRPASRYRKAKTYVEGILGSPPGNRPHHCLDTFSYPRRQYLCPNAGPVRTASANG